MVSIGTFPEEDAAYDLVTKLYWILPTVIFTAGLLDAFLVCIYMRFAHPWKDILFGAENPKNVSNPAEKIPKIPNQANGTAELQKDVEVSEPEKSQNVSENSPTELQEVIEVSNSAQPKTDAGKTPI
jgi:hypothetical protein